MKIPNAASAVVELEKLRGYCLSRSHPTGRHKARVFASRLGITARHAEMLRAALIRAAWTGDAIPTITDEHGRRYVIDFEMKGPASTGSVRSAWIIRLGEDFPRLTSCYVL